MAHRRNSIALATTGITYAAANTTVAAGGVTFPSSPLPNQIFVHDTGAGWVMYAYIMFYDGKMDWAELINATF